MIDFIFMESQAQIDSVSDGEALICNTVTIVSDAAFPVVERDEYFDITLSSEDNIVLEGGSARVTIMDNDGGFLCAGEILTARTNKLQWSLSTRDKFGFCPLYRGCPSSS